MERGPDQDREVFEDDVQHLRLVRYVLKNGQDTKKVSLSSEKEAIGGKFDSNPLRPVSQPVVQVGKPAPSAGALMAVQTGIEGNEELVRTRLRGNGGGLIRCASAMFKDRTMVREQTNLLSSVLGRIKGFVEEEHVRRQTRKTNWAKRECTRS